MASLLLDYNISIFYMGEFCVTDKKLLEKLRAEYEQKIAEMELRYKQEIALLKEENGFYAQASFFVQI